MPRAGVNAKAIVDAAAKIADEEGPRSLSLSRVAEALGVRTPSLYSHIGGLEDLRGRLRLRGIQEMGSVIRDAAVGRAQRDALRAAGQALRAYAQRHPGTYEAAQRAPGADEQESAAAASVTVQVLLALLSGYGLQGSEAIHAARAVRSALHGFIALEAAGAFAMAEDVEESFSRLLDLLDSGLRSAAASPSA